MSGILFIVSAPSGAGKTSLVRALMERIPALAFSVSFTTRPPRPNEVDGRDYHFVTPGEFERKVDAGEFLEHARVFDNYYGTSERAVRDQLAAGRDVVLEIDWQGARQVRRRFPAAISLFILPPSLEELERRLRGRGTDSEEVVARRLAQARDDLGHWAEYDYLVVNDQFDSALDDLGAIVRAERLRGTRRPDWIPLQFGSARA